MATGEVFSEARATKPLGAPISGLAVFEVRAAKTPSALSHSKDRLVRENIAMRFVAMAITSAVVLLNPCLTHGQTAPADRPLLLSDQVHKNLQLLKGIPEDEFMNTMGFFSASLGEGCEFCHGPDSIGRAGSTLPTKLP